MPTLPPPKIRRILLIDDDRLQQRLMQGLVQNFRGGTFELDGAQTYEEGLKKLLSGKYAVCLLDYQLDAKDGLALLREARIAGSETPVIILTADDSEEVDIAAMEAGAVDYLVKATINPRLLERSIRYALKLGETLAQLRQLAQRDELTRLLNRREFSRILNEEWDRSVRFKRPFALVMVDIDHFKKINDTHGHQVGDEVLRHVASLLAGQVRTVDRVARYGGEEFALIMIETDAKGATENIKRLGVLLAETPCVVESRNLTVDVTLSAGVATSLVDANSATDLVEAADKALYAAKKGGRNRIVMADGTVVPFK
jgi:diguanylate cyclase (GGDEF)-like protein